MIDPLSRLSPLPKHLRGQHCSCCDKPQATWTVRGTPAPVFICSLCVLYDSAAGRQVAERAEAVRGDVERSRKKPFPLQDGKLFNCADADDVLGVLVLSARVLGRRRG